MNDLTARGTPGAGPPAADGDGPEVAPTGFLVHLDVFEGPFDLLLGLISKHKLDITEVALSQVTDEFIAYIRSQAADWDLDQASYFLLVAATLLDLKAARLLPSGEVEDEEDLALLEARDLLFARLLQYRAYKEVAAVFADRFATEQRRHPRSVPMEAAFADLLPEVLIRLGPQEFAMLAARALAPKAPPSVSVEHIHAPRASVREQAALIVEQLRLRRSATFRELTADCAGTYEVVARFLALLELFREAAVSFQQHDPLSELHVSWVGADEGEVELGADDYEGAALEPVGDDAAGSDDPTAASGEPAARLGEPAAGLGDPASAAAAAPAAPAAAEAEAEAERTEDD